MFFAKMNYIKVIDEIRNVSDKASYELDRLQETLARVAPEVHEEVFWYGWGKTTGLADICEDHFRNDIAVYNIFQSAKAQGVVSQNEQCE